MQQLEEDLISIDNIIANLITGAADNAVDKHAYLSAIMAIKAKNLTDCLECTRKHTTYNTKSVDYAGNCVDLIRLFVKNANAPSDYYDKQIADQITMMSDHRERHIDACIDAIAECRRALPSDKVVSLLNNRGKILRLSLAETISMSERVMACFYKNERIIL